MVSCIYAHTLISARVRFFFCCCCGSKLTRQISMISVWEAYDSIPKTVIWYHWLRVIQPPHPSTPSAKIKKIDQKLLSEFMPADFSWGRGGCQRKMKILMSALSGNLTNNSTIFPTWRADLVFSAAARFCYEPNFGEPNFNMLLWYLGHTELDETKSEINQQ